MSRRFRLAALAMLTGGGGLMRTPALASEFEPPAVVEVERWLTDEELASRLAAFLWRAGPDEELRASAARRQLHRPEILRREAARLLADARSREFVNAFLDHWLALGAADRPTAAAVAEAQTFVRRLLRENRAVSALIDAPVPLLKRRLAVRMPEGKPDEAGPARLARSVARALIEFARGAPLRESDALAVDDILARSRVDGYRLGTLVHEVVQSELFQTK